MHIQIEVNQIPQYMCAKCCPNWNSTVGVPLLCYNQTTWQDWIGLDQPKSKQLLASKEGKGPYFSYHHCGPTAATSDLHCHMTLYVLKMSRTSRQGRRGMRDALQTMRRNTSSLSRSSQISCCRVTRAMDPMGGAWPGGSGREGGHGSHSEYTNYTNWSAHMLLKFTDRMV